MVMMLKKRLGSSDKSMNCSEQDSGLWKYAQSTLDKKVLKQILQLNCRDAPAPVATYERQIDLISSILTLVTFS